MNSSCIFCEIIKGLIPVEKVYEDKLILAFYYNNPVSEKHVLVVPKKHIESLNTLEEEDYTIVNHITFALPKISCMLGLEKGYKTLINTGVMGGQSIFHLHYHIIGGKIYEQSFLLNT